MDRGVKVSAGSKLGRSIEGPNLGHNLAPSKRVILCEFKCLPDYADSAP